MEERCKESKAILEGLRPDCTQKERQLYVAALKKGQAVLANLDDDNNREPLTNIRFLTSLDRQFQLQKPQLEALQLQHQLMPCVGLMGIFICLLVGFFIHSL